MTKTLQIFVLILCIGLVGNTQEVQKNFINYQGVASDASGTAMAETSMTIQITLRFGSATASAGYIENHTVTTDSNGVFSLQIGNGTLVSGAFNAEDWGTEASYVTVSLNGVEVGTTEMVAVPYAISSGDTQWKRNGTAIENKNAGSVKVLTDLEITGTIKTQAGATINEFSTDGTLADNSDTAVPTEKAVKSYVDNITTQSVTSIDDLSDAKADANGSSLFLGLDAGANDDGTDNSNVAVGYQALNSNITGTGNVALGHKAGLLETGSNKLYIDNSDTESPLLYGEFDTDRLTVNGDFKAMGRMLLNTDQPLNMFTDFTIRSQTNGFGGMYIDSPDEDFGQPFYGYAVNGGIKAYHYFDTNEDTWKLTHDLGGSLALSNTGRLSTSGGLDIGTDSDYNFTISDDGRMLLNTDQPLNTFTDFTIRSQTNSFGGMYIDSPDEDSGQPFYGYAVNGTVKAYHYFDAADDTWKLTYDGSENLIFSNTGTLSVPNGLNVEGNVSIGDVGVPNVALDIEGSIQYTGTITDVSDRRLKENLKTITNALEKLKGINGYSYNMKNDQDKIREYGVIAQDVQSVFPEMVTIVEQENEYLGVSYTQLIPVLINAIKEQQIQIETLQNSNRNKDSRIAEVLERLRSLESLVLKNKEEASSAWSKK